MLSSVAMKYARALADVAFKTRQSNQVSNQLLVFGELLHSHDQLREVLLTPAIPFSAKQKVIECLAEKLPLGQTTVNFLLVLLENARLDQFDQVVESFHRVVDERQGVTRAEVFSSQKIPGLTRERLANTLSTKLGTKMKFNYQLDESLIGGLKLQIGSMLFDGSIRTQLDVIRRRLTSE